MLRLNTLPVEVVSGQIIGVIQGKIVSGEEKNRTIYRAGNL